MRRVPRTGDARVKARARETLARFRRDYEPPHSFLDHETPFQLLVAVLLSAQTTDRSVNAITPALFARYPTAEAMAAAPLDELERLLKGVSFHRVKARNARETARLVAERFGGEVPRAMEDLTALPGVGRKTAAVVQGHVWGEAERVAVDTHVKRVTFRLGLTDTQDPDKASDRLGALYPREDWPPINYYFIVHGRTTCVARRPRCGDCVVEDLCPKQGVLLPESDPAARPHPTKRPAKGAGAARAKPPATEGKAARRRPDKT